MKKFRLHVEIQQLHVFFRIFKDVFVKVVKSDIVDVLRSTSLIVDEVGDYVEIEAVLHGRQHAGQIVQGGGGSGCPGWSCS